MSSWSRHFLGTLGLCGALSLSCATSQTGATEVNLARARDQATPGASIFSRECVQCHGQRGEGIGSAPAVLGPGALPEFPRSTGSADPSLIDPQQLQLQMQTRPAGAASRDPFRNAQDLFRFIRTQMPKSHPGTLAEGDYWAVSNFLLAAQGASLPPGGVGPTNASTIAIPRL